MNSIRLSHIFIFLVISSAAILLTIKFSSESTEVEATKSKPKNLSEAADIQLKIISSENETFGYNILVNDKTIIHQPNIPAVSGNQGFQTREDAKKVGKLVIQKLRNKKFPPTITVDELDSLGVL